MHLLSSSKKFSNKIERWKGGRRGELRPSERNTVNGVVHSAVTGEEKEIKFPYSSISIHFTHGSRSPLPFVQTILSSSPPILSIYPDKFPNFNGENRTKLSNCFPTHRCRWREIRGRNVSYLCRDFLLYRETCAIFLLILSFLVLFAFINTFDSMELLFDFSSELR